MAFEFEDRLSCRIYKKITDSFTNQEAVSYFERRAYQFDGDTNSLPRGTSLSIENIICFDTYPLSDTILLKGSLHRLVGKDAKLDAETKKRYKKNIDKFMQEATYGINSLSFHWVSEKPISIKSHYFAAASLSLSLIGGNLIRVFLDLQPSTRFKNHLNAATSKQIPTTLRLRRLPSLRKEVYQDRVSYGNDKKLKILERIDAKANADLEHVMKKYLPQGIYRKAFGGTPSLQIYRYIENIDAISSQHSSSDTGCFFKLLATASGGPSYGLFVTKGDDQLIENNYRNRPSVSQKAKFIRVAGDSSLSYRDILITIAQKAAMQHILFRLNNLKIKLVRPSLRKAVANLEKQRLDLYQLSTIFELFSGGFEKEQSSFLGSLRNADTLTRWTGASSGSPISFSNASNSEINHTCRQIRSEIDHLSNGYSILRDESANRFEVRISWIAIVLSLFFAPVAQIALERYTDWRFPVDSPSQTK
jgi:hypothetical protein